MDTVCNNEIFGIISEKLDNKVQVYVDSSFDQQSKPGDENGGRFGSGWAIKGKHGLIGFGVVKADEWYCNSSQASELKGIITFFRILERYFSSYYTDKTEFVIKCDNLWLIRSLQTFFEKTSNGETPDKEVMKNLGGYSKNIANIANKFKVSFAWVKGHNGEHYNELVDTLAQASFRSKLSKVDYAQTIRAHNIANAIDVFRTGTKAKDTSFIFPSPELNRLIKTYNEPVTIVIPNATSEPMATWKTTERETDYLLIKRETQTKIDIHLNAAYSHNYINENLSDPTAYIGVGAIILNSAGESVCYGTILAKKRLEENAEASELRAMVRFFDMVLSARCLVNTETEIIVHSPCKELIEELKNLETREEYLTHPHKEFGRKNSGEKMRNILKAHDLKFVWKNENDATAYDGFIKDLAARAENSVRDNNEYSGRLRKRNIRKALNTLYSPSENKFPMP